MNKLTRPFEVKKTDDQSGVFEGYASVFGEVDSHSDIVMPGAFTKSLAEDHKAKNRLVPMLWHHDPASPIGVYREIAEDEKGLLVKGEINLDVARGREAYSLVKQGAISGLSIGYRTVRASKGKGDGATRHLHELQLGEISLVTFPSGDTARVHGYKAAEALQTLSECEQYLRDVGFTHKEAKAFIARAKAIQPDPSDSVKAALAIIKSL